MLSLIRAKNYAVIDEVELEFPRGFSVMTGETGAGKSILVDALGLALGDRADAGAVRHGAERAEISVLFEIPHGHAALEWLAERGLEDDTNCALRRVVGADGRSRAFINGQPATLQDLKALGGLLVDIHGQHAHQSLLETGAQRALLDSYGGHEALAAKVAAAYTAWRTLESDLATRRTSGANRAAELELLRFQAAEIETLAVADGEPERLALERERLANTDRLLSGANAALERLAESDTASAYSAVVHARRELERLVEHDPSLRAPVELLAGIEAEIRDVESTLSHYRDRIEADPERLTWVDERLARIRAVARRHGVAPEELGATLAGLRTRIASLDDSAGSLEDLAARAATARATFLAEAKKLGAKRAKQAASLGPAVTAELAELGMPNGEFRVDLAPKTEDHADAHGLERVEFQVRLNPGQPFGALSKVASGGELSRLSLAIEVVRSGASPVTAFVFDEVDTGIGGRVAEIVGRKLRELAKARQVLCVTHLPQVASQGQAHYRVVKLTDGKASRTQVKPLSAEERVEELSRMLGGVEITDRTRAHAAEMIERAAR
ncbi:MAG TPA: DNA repair protein RecN [Gammaproteobacteria bacterium]|jgi:DNA repair protein RecN (Recombination protein N)|nr:DNA repair protein RecN [Gammaproteobacteria bacterium]